ncbi:MAG: protoporphyrinogen oxidase HemJ [Rickettsiaceae bacterium]|nr:protoporphyrinogen oxidase HemJ [Rickettsiaceae bacterium]
MTEYYEWIKAFHIIAVISWMAGLLYLPRLYVYHAGVEKDSEASYLFKLMELRLLRYIMNPAMVATFIFGFILTYIYGIEALGPWFHIKMTCITLLAVFHGMLARWRRDFERNANIKGPNFFRVMNEVPTALMIISVVMVVVKPF